MAQNNVKNLRESLMMSKAELARKSGLSSLTIDRVESGGTCRLDTKRKILNALGFKVSDRGKVFSEGEGMSAHHEIQDAHRGG